MSWNYRVVHRKGTNTLGGRQIPYDYYEVHEVYYNGPTPDGMSAKGSWPGGQSIKSFLSDWRSYRKAMVKPVLIWDDNKGKFLGEEPALVAERS